MDRLRSFYHDARGTIAIEAILLFPVLAWIFLLSYLYFDGFRAKNSNVKAAYTIADAITREQEIDATYVTNLATLLNNLTVSRFATQMRVSAITFDEDAEVYEVAWSKAQGSDFSELTTAAVGDISDRLPVILSGDTIILVETAMDYEPVFNIGLPTIRMENFIFTTPRFTRKVCFIEADATALCPQGEEV